MRSTAAAVAGANAAGEPAASRPSDTGLAPSTSTSGGIAPATSVSRSAPGNGVWQITPCTDGSAPAAASAARIVGASASVGSSTTPAAMSSFVAVRTSDRTYHAVLSSPVATTIVRPGTTPSARSAATRVASPAPMSAAIFLPSMSMSARDPLPHVGDDLPAQLSGAQVLVELLAQLRPYPLVLE